MTTNFSGAGTFAHIPGVDPNSFNDPRALAQLNQALRKSVSTAGYQDASSGGGTYGAIMPQSIENTLTSLEYDKSYITAWDRIPKTMVHNTLHEQGVRNKFGNDLDPFFSEGGVGAFSGSDFSKLPVKIKFLSERRRFTDVATMVGKVGVNPSLLAEETQAGTHNILRKCEIALWHANEANNPLHFTGLIPQIINGDGIVEDMRGLEVTAELFEHALAQAYSLGRHGLPDDIYCAPSVRSALSARTASQGRHNQLQITADSRLHYGRRNITIAGPAQTATIRSAPFLNIYQQPCSVAAVGESGKTPATPTLDAATTPVDGTSLFGVNDAGDYIYKIVAVGNYGKSAPLTTAALGVANGQAAQIDLTDSAQKGNSDSSVHYYKVYRSEKDGDASTCLFIGDYPINEGAGGGDTRITDLHERVYGTSDVVMMRMIKPEVELFRLLDLFRRFLPDPGTSKEFLLMLFASPLVKTSQKCVVLRNVKTPVASTGSLLQYAV